MQDGNREEREETARSGPQNPTGAILEAELEILDQFEDMLDLVPGLGYHGEGHKKADPESQATAPLPVQPKQHVDGDEEAKIGGVVHEVHRLDVKDASQHAAPVEDTQVVNLHELNDVLDQVESLHRHQ